MIEKASNLVLDWKPATALGLVIYAFLVLSIRPAFSGDLTEDFKIRKVGSRCEPEMDEWIAVPGRDMKAGSFVYRYTQVTKAGCVKLYTRECIINHYLRG